jgi:type I restriction enzyme M protein
MVKEKNIKKQKTIEESLWESATKLRGTVDPSEYKHIVLGLIFLKFAGDKFEQQRDILIKNGQQKYIEMADFYNQNNVFFQHDQQNLHCQC